MTTAKRRPARDAIHGTHTSAVKATHVDGELGLSIYLNYPGTSSTKSQIERTISSETAAPKSHRSSCFERVGHRIYRRQAEKLATTSRSTKLAESMNSTEELLTAGYDRVRPYFICELVRASTIKLWGVMRCACDVRATPWDAWLFHSCCSAANGEPRFRLQSLTRMELEMTKQISMPRPKSTHAFRPVGH